MRLKKLHLPLENSCVLWPADGIASFPMSHSTMQTSSQVQLCIWKPLWEAVPFMSWLSWGSAIDWSSFCLWGTSYWPRNWVTHHDELPVGPEAEGTYHGLPSVEEEVPWHCATLHYCRSSLAANIWSHLLKYTWNNLVLASFKGQSVTFPETNT